jgi:hypothetical protein
VLGSVFVIDGLKFSLKAHAYHSLKIKISFKDRKSKGGKKEKTIVLVVDFCSNQVSLYILTII